MDFHGLGSTWLSLISPTPGAIQWEDGNFPVYSQFGFDHWNGPTNAVFNNTIPVAMRNDNGIWKWIPETNSSTQTYYCVQEVDTTNVISLGELLKHDQEKIQIIQIMIS